MLGLANVQSSQENTLVGGQYFFLELVVSSDGQAENTHL